MKAKNLCSLLKSYRILCDLFVLATRSLAPFILKFNQRRWSPLKLIGRSDVQRNYPSPAPSAIEPPEDSIATLVSMGFDRSSARQALVQARNDVNMATNILLEAQAHWVHADFSPKGILIASKDKQSWLLLSNHGGQIHLHIWQLVGTFSDSNHCIGNSISGFFFHTFSFFVFFYFDFVGVSFKIISSLTTKNSEHCIISYPIMEMLSNSLGEE